MELSFREATPCKLTKKRDGKAIATSLYVARNAFEQALGLMGRKLKKGEAIIFLMPRRMRFSLHMWFVFSPIDVLYCDREGDLLRVVDIKRTFKPFTATTAKKEADLFIELPEGASKGLNEGDLLEPSRKIFKP